MKPNDDILSHIKPQPEMEPPELDFARLRERAEARKLRRELFWVAIRRMAVGPRDAAGVYPPLPGGPGDSGRGVAGPYGRGIFCPVLCRRGGLPHPLRQTKGETIMSTAAGFIFLIPFSSWCWPLSQPSASSSTGTRRRGPLRGGLDPLRGGCCRGLSGWPSIWWPGPAGRPSSARTAAGGWRKPLSSALLREKLKLACPGCGTAVEPDWKVCPNCAAPLPEREPPVKEKEKGLGWLLAICVIIPLVLVIGLICLMVLPLDHGGYSTSGFTTRRTRCWPECPELQGTVVDSWLEMLEDEDADIAPPLAKAGPHRGRVGEAVEILGCYVYSGGMTGRR